MKRNVKSIVGNFFYLFFPLLCRNRKLRIVLMYHRVIDCLPDDKFFDSGMYVTAHALEKHILQIRKYFQIVPLAEILNPNVTVNENICAITFDDGWYDNYQFAFPVLKKHNVPASIFLPVKYIGTDRQHWFQVFWETARYASANGVLSNFTSDLCRSLSGYVTLEDATLKTIMLHLKHFPPAKLDQLMNTIQEKYGSRYSTTRSTMNWDEVNEMENHNISFGSHSLNHFILTSLDSTQKCKEITDSFKFLSQKLSNFLPFFCYPNGNWDDECIQYVQAAGYQGAVTTRRGSVTQHQNSFLLNRIGMHEDISSSDGLFWFRIFQALAADRKKP